MALVIKSAGFENLLDPSGGAYLKALIMGEPSVGKTPFAACWPNPIIADCEDGILSVASKGTPYARIRSAADMDAFIQHLRTDALRPIEARKYQTVIWDTVDTYQEILMMERAREQRVDSFRGFDNWGWLATKMRQTIEQLKNLPLNVVVNMHVRDEKDSDDAGVELTKIGSSLKGDIGKSIYRHFDLIGLMEKSYEAVDGERVLKRRVRWHSEPKFPMLRDRSGRLPKFTDVQFEDSDFTQLFETIVGSVDDLPASKELESIDVVGDQAPVRVAPADAAGGPVPDPVLPPVKGARKAPAKKAAEPPPAEPAALVEPVIEDKDLAAPSEKPVEPPTEPPEPQMSAAAPPDPVALLGETLGAIMVVDEIPAAVEPEASPVTEPVAAPASTPKPDAPVCGSQAAGMKGEPVEGCGVVLDASNNSRVAIAQLRTKTRLCVNCWAKYAS